MTNFGKEPSSCMRSFRFGAPIASLVAFAVAMFFNALASTDAESLGWGIFKRTTGNVSDQFPLEITPSGWTFSIWGFIYTYQVIFLLYWLTLLCRKSRVTSLPLYLGPDFLPSWLGILYVCNMGFNIGWLLLWDRLEIEASLAMLVLLTLTLYTMLGLSFAALDRHARQLTHDGDAIEVRLTIGIVHNALGMYATWVTVASLLNVAMVLAHTSVGLSVHIASTVALVLLAAVIVVLLLLDHVFLERFMRYLVTPYIVLVVALIGSLDKNWDEDNANSIVTAGLLALVAVGAIIKVITMIYRTKRNPLYDEARVGTSKHLEPTTDHM